MIKFNKYFLILLKSCVESGTKTDRLCYYNPNAFLEDDNFLYALMF